MFKHILVPTDGSALSEIAVQQAVNLAFVLRAKITAIHVVGGYRPAFESEGFKMPKMPDLKERFEEEETARANKILGTVKKAAAEAGVTCFSAVVTGDSPHEAIIEYATASKCDLILMASHGRRGLDGFLLGSETQKVLTHSKIPVMVCR
jgi:nucleotide-binding universal stress UspA family protein